MDFRHLAVIVRAGGAGYRIALLCIVPPNNKSNPVSFICIDQLVVPVLISSNVSEMEYGLSQNSEYLFDVDENSGSSLFCCIAELVAGLSVLGTHGWSLSVPRSMSLSGKQLWGSSGVFSFLKPRMLWLHEGHKAEMILQSTRKYAEVIGKGKMKECGSLNSNVRKKSDFFFNGSM